MRGVARSSESFGRQQWDEARSLAFLLWILIGIFVFGVLQPVFADEPYEGSIPPVVVGAACTEPYVYHWTTITKSPWTLSRVVAIPLGYASPLEWEGTDAFWDALAARVGPDGTLEDMASGLYDLLSESQVTIYVDFERSVARHEIELACLDGAWGLVPGSESTLNQPDDSEWIGLLEESVDRNAVSNDSLLTALTSKLDSLNGQPGSDTRPYHSYTRTSP